jgi:hypothetical protein
MPRAGITAGAFLLVMTDMSKAIRNFEFRKQPSPFLSADQRNFAWRREMVYELEASAGRSPG